MNTLRDIFRKQTGFLRSLKVAYFVNNLLNAPKLRHNKTLYRQYGVRRNIFSSIGSHHFPPTRPADAPWLNKPNAAELAAAHPDFQVFDAEIQAQILHYIENGYLILREWFDGNRVARLNTEIDELRAARTIDFNFSGRKLMDAFRFSPTADAFFKDEKLLQLLNFLMGRAVIPFQTLHFVKGSEQKAHSDYIHMATHPAGFLIAAWTALEDVHDENGAVFYYPKSHKLPFLTCQDYPSGNSHWRIGSQSNQQFEQKVAALIEEHDLKPQKFFAQAGDVLIWHANLLHGGSAITNPDATRRSMVAHYFCKGVICYHEMTQRPALMR